MSFGFSVGDILLASKLAYKLYSTIADGKRSSAKDLRELGDALFGLRCALDHLGKAAEDIWATTSNTQDADAVEIRQKLDAMVASCGCTLQELDSVTQRYKEVTKPAGSEVEVDDAGVVPSVGAPTLPNNKRSITRFKNNVQINWLKIRWGIERGSLGEYRARLQSHMDALNMVLNTFLWSATHRIEVDGRVNAAKMQELQDHALQSNTSLLQLAQDIRALLLPTKHASSQRPATSPETASTNASTISPIDARKNELVNALKTASMTAPTTALKIAPIIALNNASTNAPTNALTNPPTNAPTTAPNTTPESFDPQLEIVQNDGQSLGMASGKGPGQGTMHSISHHYKPVAHMATIQPSNLIDNISTCFGPLAMRPQSSSPARGTPSHPIFNANGKRELPASIVNLNLRRQSNGSKAFQDYQKKHLQSRTIPQKPSFLSLEIPTILQLRDGLSYVFRTLPHTTARQATFHGHERQKEIIRWAQGLDHLLDSCTAESMSASPPELKKARHANQNEMIDLIVALNDSIEKSNDVMKRHFYQATERAGFDGVLGKLQTVSRSVRAMKEIEEFQDARDEWKDSQTDA